MKGIDETTVTDNNADIADPDHGHPREAHGPAFRDLQAMLKKEDVSFGGLVRIQNKRREFVWVHPDYVEEARQLCPGVQRK